MDRPGDNDRSGEDASMLEESHFTPKQVELFQCRYENGYDLYKDTDYVPWLMDNYPEDVPDEILGEIGSELNRVRSDPLLLFKVNSRAPDLRELTMVTS